MADGTVTPPKKKPGASNKSSAKKKKKLKPSTNEGDNEMDVSSREALAEAQRMSNLNSISLDSELGRTKSKDLLAPSIIPSKKKSSSKSVLNGVINLETLIEKNSIKKRVEEKMVPLSKSIVTEAPPPSFIRRAKPEKARPAKPKTKIKSTVIPPVASAAMQTTKRDGSKIVTFDEQKVPSEISSEYQKSGEVINSGYKKKKTTISSRIYAKHGELKKRYPKAIIAGVKKCGTRALLSFLSAHPLIISAGSEKHFFEKDEKYNDWGFTWYLNDMPMSYESEMVIEKTPGYFPSLVAPERIAKFSKTQKSPIKIIFIVRDPVDRAISDYAQGLSKDPEKPPFKDLVFGKKSASSPLKVKNRSMVTIGLYAKHFKRWLQFFPRSQMLFVNGDKFIKNPLPELEKVQKFLNLPVEITAKDMTFNKTKGFWCINVNKHGNSTVDCLGEGKGRPRPPVDTWAVEKLRAFYAPHNEEFNEMTGIDFNRR